MLRAVIADDEVGARATLRAILEQLEVEVVGEASDGTEALRLIDERRPDVAFFDIEMPKLDGLEAATRAGLPPIVFVTAHADRAHRAFDADAVDYVVKPIEAARIRTALDRVLRRTSFDALRGDSPWRLRVTDHRGTTVIDSRAVVLFSATDKYTRFRLHGEEHFLRESLDALEERLAPFGFIRVHRAHLVRVAAILRAVNDDRGLVIELSNGDSLPVAKRSRAAVRAALAR